ncbi:MAG: PHP domain-containing protein [Actinomycetota bacterium]|nr:PHP domain-containing protein [Actinomycetota bacterium]
MIIDLHIHTNLGSICSQLGPDELLERAQQMGIDAVCVTEHHSHRGANKMVEYAAASGYPVFRGVEIYTELGDMLVYGLKHETRYHLTTFEELTEMAQEDGAVIVPAHPCRGWGRKHKHAHVFPRELIGQVAAIETMNGANTLRSNEAAMAIAEECGLRGTGGSDAHAIWQVGKCVTVFEKEITSEEELVHELREGRFVAAYLDDLRKKEEESA